MEAASSAPSGRLVARTKALSYAWGDCPVVRDLSTTILRGDRVGIVGPNGSGKTTLIRLLLGELAPDGGEVRLGTNLEVAYFDQLHSSLELDRSARDNVTDGAQMVTVNGRSRHVIGYLGEFLFPPEMIDNPVRTLSGGERNRLLLARLFARPSNLLVLDEPTNDLDVPTLEVLENLLSEYDGTMLLVSHDRELLDGVVTSLLVLGGDGRVREFVGGYSDWLVRREEERAARVASEAAAAPPREKPRPKPKSGLSFREQRELEALTARIEELEARQRSLHERMADPAFYQGGGEAIATAKRDLEAIDQEISAAYARWESLEDLKHR